MATEKTLKVGCSVNIKRTNGRIHPALVAGISYEQKCATVEWFEQGETKGKEVDLDLIESLNPDVTVFREEECEEGPAEVQSEIVQSYIKDNATKSTEQRRMTQLQAPDYNCSSYPNFEHTRNLSPPKNVPNAPVGRKALPIAKNAKRGNVVKEIETLKKNREQRRQRQAEERAEKEAFLQMAPYNPHWETLNMIQEYRRNLDIKPLSENEAIDDHPIAVCIRKRPLSKLELSRKEVDIITVPSKNQLLIHEPKNKVDLTRYLENHLFRFDYTFDETCSNATVYKYTAQPLLKTIFEGGYATCFAYGQTGSGKTHTMGGNFIGKNQDCQKGVYAMVTTDVFKLCNSPQYRNSGFMVSASFFEIYSGKIFDLLNKKKRLRILEDAKQQVQVVSLTEIIVNSTEEVLKLIQKGNAARTSGQTSANLYSSRSHAIFQIVLRAIHCTQKVHGKFSLIDLAGNERGADTFSSDRQTRMEGAEINKSLLALKECIRALERKGAHLPFRVSKLTQVLRDSFVRPNCRTCMIAMISPGVGSCEHTLNTLRYADRVKELGGGELPTVPGNELYSETLDDEDLLQLNSLNNNDMTPEMLNFHQVITELEAAEDNLLENHKQVVEHLRASAEKAETLLRTADNIAYDQEVYCKSWEQLIDNTVTRLMCAKELICDYKTKLAAEEKLSRETKRK